MTINRKYAVSLFAIIVLTVAIYAGMRHTQGQWIGVDENVVEKFAEQAGRPAQLPLINTDQGDLLLFVFLLGGAVGGFLMGYNFRALFGAKEAKNAPDA